LQEPIRIADPRLKAADHHIGGTFGVHDIPAMLDIIQIGSPVAVTEADD